jgi:moderate conductance mechanosensitive channel
LPIVPHYLQITAIIAAMLAGFYLVNGLIGLVVPWLARGLARRSDNATTTDKVLQIRREETLLGIGAAVVRAGLIGVVVYLAWRLAMPETAPIALIGASAFFAIVAGSTVGLLLRDVTFGTMMIAERWYNVGDHIVVEPFINVSGVVEQLTPRSTKLRSLSGEVIWLHNQHIQAAKVTSRGVRTLALDVFVTDLEAGKRVIEQAIRTLPTGPTMLAKQLNISETEQLGDGLWRITAVGQTTPGREWLIEDFALKAINKYDGLSKSGPSIVHGPIARYADAAAEHRFRRSIRARA